MPKQTNKIPKSKEAAKDFITSITRKWCAQGMVLEVVEDMKSIIIEDELSGPIYLNELFQNADDAGANRITVKLVDDYLIISHDGKHFSFDDIENISRICNKKSKKRSDPMAVGQKGLGFKSVFYLSEYVLVSSANALFRFDKTAPELNALEAKPWELIPIWTEHDELPPVLKTAVKTDDVVFCIRVCNSNKIAEIKQTINELNKHAERMIFLNNIRQIDISAAEIAVKLFYKHIEQENTPTRIEISAQKSEQLESEMVSQWYLFKETFTYSDVLQKQIDEDKDIAEKYKSTQQQKPSFETYFAYPIPRNSVRTKHFKQPFFCCLPTEVYYKNFPFLVSSRFQVEISRMQFSAKPLAKELNLYIFSKIFALQFHCLEAIATQTDNWQEVVNLLAIPSVSDLTQYFSKVNIKTITQSYEQALQTANFLKTCAEQPGYVSVKDGVYDQYGFIQRFTTEETLASTFSSELKSIEQLAKNIYTIEKIIEAIPGLYNQDFQHDLAISVKLVAYLSTIKLKKAHIELLNSVKFIMGTDKQLHTSAEIFLPNERLNYLSLNLSQVAYVHPLIINKALDKNTKWLSLLSIMPVQLATLVKKFNNSDELASFTSLLATHQSALNESDIKALNKIKIYRLDVAEPLSNSEKQLYMPGNRLFELIDLPVINLNKYSTEDTGKLNELFMKLGSWTDVNEGNLADIVKHVTENCAAGKIIGFTIALCADYPDLVAKAFKLGLPVIDHQQQPRSPKNCYLSDVFTPVHPMQEQQSKLHFVADDYYNLTNDAENLKSCLLSAGVEEVISFSETKRAIKRNQIKHEYYLSSLNTPDYLKSYGKRYYVIGLEYCLAEHRAMGYLHQHEIINYAELKLYDQIKDAPIVFKIIADALSARNDLTSSRYTTALGTRSIPSPLQFYFYQSLVRQFNLKPNQLYTPALAKRFAKVLYQDNKPAQDFNALELDLSDDNWHLLGVNTELSKRDILKILQSDIGLTREDYQLIYHTIAKKRLRIGDDELPTSITLPSMSGELTRLNKLLILSSPNTTLSRGSDCILELPNELQKNSTKAKAISDFFKLEYVEISALEINHEPLPYPEHLSDLLYDRLARLGAYLKCLDKSIELNALLESWLSRLATTRIIFCSSITLMYKSIFQRNVNTWIHDDIIYYDNSPARLLWKHLSALLHDFFCVPDTVSLRDIEDIFTTDDFDDLIIMLSEFVNYSAEDVEDAQQIISSLQSQTAEPSAKRLKQISESGLTNEQTSFRYDEAGAVDHKPALGKRHEPETEAQTQGKTKQIKMQTIHNSNEAVGHAGEAFVFNRLAEHYQAKYPSATFSETHDGFKLADDNLELEVIWHNKHKEEYGQKDLTIKKNGVERIIDVKTTKYQYHASFPVSKDEWKVAKAYGERYRFFRVENINGHATFYKIKNPEAKYRDKSLKRAYYVTYKP